MSSLEKTFAVIQQQFIRYVYSAYLIFGVTGCCLNIVLFSQRHFRTVSSCICKFDLIENPITNGVSYRVDFLMSLVAMLLVIPLGIVPYIYSLHYPNPYTAVLAFCKFRTCMLQSLAMIPRCALPVV
jgi:hypothetical protein